MTIYAIRATVARSEGQTRSIEWTWEGNGSASLSWNAWRKMKSNGLTIDTAEPFLGAVLAKGDEIIETQHGAGHSLGWQQQDLT